MCLLHFYSLTLSSAPIWTCLFFMQLLTHAVREAAIKSASMIIVFFLHIYIFNAWSLALQYFLWLHTLCLSFSLCVHFFDPMSLWFLRKIDWPYCRSRHYLTGSLPAPSQRTGEARRRPRCLRPPASSATEPSCPGSSNILFKPITRDTVLVIFVCAIIHYLYCNKYV